MSNSAPPPIPPKSPLRPTFESVPPIPPKSPFRSPPLKPLPPIPSQSKNTARPDSFTLPPIPYHTINLNNLHLLNFSNFHHVAVHPAHDSAPPQIQYWLRAEVVLAGLPGEDCVPPGHWPRLVQLAQDTCSGRRGGQAKRTSTGKMGPLVQEVRLLTAWYIPGQEEDGMMDVVDSEE
ncbi:hypothetical protein ACHAQJ_008062 [Trichoderma viride]